MNATPRPFIAADIGGTHVRIGLVRADGAPGRPVSVMHYRKYACADYASPVEIFRAFLDGLGPTVSVDEGVIACAGHLLENGSLITTNLPWPLEPRLLCEQLGFSDLRIVNDFEAVAYATATVDVDDTVHIAGPRTPSAPGPILVLGPGTGLGAALWIPTDAQAVVLATEAGQAALAPGNAIEMALLAHLQSQRGHVPVEAALSGPGLMNLHSALCAIRGGGRTYATPGEITRAAVSGEDALARESLEIFCSLLGSVVGDLALLYGVHGGVYLAGGILPQIRDFLLNSGFVARFLDKGPMRAALERIPVRLVDHGQLGVIGAADWYLRQRGTGRDGRG
jgi:glucokinase